MKQTQSEYEISITKKNYDETVLVFKFNIFRLQDTIEMSEVDGETRMSELFRRRYAYPLFVSVDLTKTTF